VEAQGSGLRRRGKKVVVGVVETPVIPSFTSQGSGILVDPLDVSDLGSPAAAASAGGPVASPAGGPVASPAGGPVASPAGGPVGGARSATVGLLPPRAGSRWPAGGPSGCGVGRPGPQKGKARRDRCNLPSRLEKSPCLLALWGAQHPAGWHSLGNLLASRIRSRELEPAEFRCVRIITLERASRGPQVAPLGDRRYR
jgi:hypothetical protein